MKDPFAEGAQLWPHEDPDAINLAAFTATWRWREKIQPFQHVGFPHIEAEMTAIGKRLTDHVDSDARAKKEAKRQARLERSGGGLKQVIARIVARAEQARHEALIAQCAVPDDVATGW